MSTTLPVIGAPVTAPRASAILGTYKRAPVTPVGGQGAELVDDTGRSYIDFVAGIAVNALGYGDDGLRAALHAAADGLVHVSNLYRSEPGEQLASWLVQHSFADKVFFCNSGAEANEGAFKFVRKWARSVGGPASAGGGAEDRCAPFKAARARRRGGRRHRRCPGRPASR